LNVLLALNLNMNIKYAVLDLATIIQGNTPADTFPRSLELAKLAEKLGYSRFWLAEHHNMVSVASSATSILIGYIAGGTSTLRVGSGGIMLPNHSPLIVAEQFGTLASLYPGRIDLGLGRAPGSDQLTALEIRGENFYREHNFPRDIQKLQTFFSAENANAKVRAIPGEGIDIPIWVLGSSTDSARVAAAMGLPYAFASHFAPTYFLDAIAIYREHFKPSKYLDKPYIIACVNVVAADTNTEAERLATSLKRLFIGIITGQRQPLQPPIDSMTWDPLEAQAVNQMLTYAFIGDPDKIKRELKTFVEQTGVDEIMATSHIFDQQARLHSYELFAKAINEINAVQGN
jgi:luciferase family oxidoreductase group 1